MEETASLGMIKQTEEGEGGRVVGEGEEDTTDQSQSPSQL
jgi:hypothetical protein